MTETQRNWYVVTGGPSCGKTTLLEELEGQGYSTIPEAAPLIIDEELEKGFAVEEIREDEQKFQDKVTRRKIEIEDNIDPDVLTFFDRGMHDTEAYFKANRFTLEQWTINAVQKASYRRSFILEALPKYKQDYARTENADIGTRINTLLYAAYTNAHIPIVKVPVLDPAGRADFVLQRLD